MKTSIYRSVLTLLSVVMFSCSALAKEALVGTISSEQLSVKVRQDFPMILEYTFLANNSALQGNVTQAQSFKINGKPFVPQVSSTLSDDKINYQLTFNEIDVTMAIQIQVIGNIVDFHFTDVNENGAYKVSSIEIPENQFLSINALQNSATFAGAKMFTKETGTEGDFFQFITQDTPADKYPQGFLYAMVNTDKLAAALWTNAIQERFDKNRIVKKSFKHNDVMNTTVSSGSWLYRPYRMNSINELPRTKIAFADDINGNGTVDWQDSAIAYRSIMNNPLGVDKIPQLVSFRIPMNFASQATNPFNKTLDETKRVYLHTDGLGQYVILKGYAGEGHDSNHPDYGYIGKRQGGAIEMNNLVNAAPLYNTMVGVHINATEAYPEARPFSEQILNKGIDKGWDWLDASYLINKRKDSASGKRHQRITSLIEQVPGLDFIYVDVWHGKGNWDGRKLAQEINDFGLMMTTEFPYDLEYNAVWNHWAVDYTYSKTDKTKGFNSQIVRFIRNHQKDTWVARHPLLGGAEMMDFEGWQGRTDYEKHINITFDTNLPTKYLQHFPIIQWQNDTIHFTDNVKVTTASGKREIYRDNHLVYNDDSYLLSWSPVQENKLYHWNKQGGKTTWTLPTSWANIDEVFVYQLSDLGKINQKKISVRNHQLTISAKASTPYVVYKSAQTQDKMTWAEGAIINNGGFNSADLSDWTISRGKPSVERNNNGQYELVFDKNSKAVISQKLGQLSQGAYIAELYVESTDNRKLTVEVKTDSGSFSNYVNASLWTNYVSEDSKKDRNMQRVYVPFNVTNFKEQVEIKITAEKGKGKIFVDDVRVASHGKIKRIRKKDKKYAFKEDFENIINGWYPFVRADAGGSRVLRTHLAEKNSPFTQKGWNGKAIDDVINGNWSLKLHEKFSGLLMQTLPHTLRFEKSKMYTVSFNYQSDSDNYAFVLGDGVDIVSETSLNTQLNTKNVEITFTASSSGNTWIGLSKKSTDVNDFIIDDLTVIENSMAANKTSVKNKH